MTDDARQADEIPQTSEPVEVEWEGGMGNTHTVRVDPYTGQITVNGRPFKIGSLCSDDVPDWLYRSSPLASDLGDDNDE